MLLLGQKALRSMVYDQKGVSDIEGLLVLVLSSIVIVQIPDIIKDLFVPIRLHDCTNIESFTCIHYMEKSNYDP